MNVSDASWYAAALRITWSASIDTRTLGAKQILFCSRAKADERTEHHLNPLKVLHCMDELMSEDSIIVADGGDFVGSAAYIMRPRGPMRWLDPGWLSWTRMRISLEITCVRGFMSSCWVSPHWEAPAVHITSLSLGPLGAFGTLGVGGGFALGAKLCRPDSEV